MTDKVPTSSSWRASTTRGADIRVTPAQKSAPNIVAPFDPQRHNRVAFSYGVEQVDNFFKRTANKLTSAGNLRVLVLTAPESDLIEFYAQNAHSVDFTELPSKYARTRPGQGSIAAAFISMIGVDSRFQREGFGGDLLVDGLRRIVNAADNVGIAIVMLDVLDCGDQAKTAKGKSHYEGYGFASLPSHLLRLFTPLATVRKLLEAP